MVIFVLGTFSQTAASIAGTADGISGKSDSLMTKSDADANDISSDMSTDVLTPMAIILNRAGSANLQLRA